MLVLPPLVERPNFSCLCHSAVPCSLAQHPRPHHDSSGKWMRKMCQLGSSSVKRYMLVSLNLHETTHLALLPCFGVEDHLENIRFSCSTLKEVPMAVQTQTQMVAAYGTYKLLTEVLLMQHQTCRSKMISDVFKYESVGQWRPARWRRSIATRAFRWTLSARGRVERHCPIFGAGFFPASIQLSLPMLERRLRSTYTPKLHARAILSPGTIRRVNANFRLVPAQRFR